MSTRITNPVENHRQIATAWAAETITLHGWTLRSDPYEAGAWECEKAGIIFWIRDWRDLCVFAKEQVAEAVK